jgi:hypothetical protein
MKKLLKELGSIQDACLGRSKNATGNNVMIRSVNDDASHQEWRLIHKNIVGHTKDWKRFRSDPNKVVLEKNFLFNSLTAMPNFFLFRPRDDGNSIFIKPKEDFLASKPKKPRGLTFIFYIVFILLGLAVVKKGNNIAGPIIFASIFFVLLLIVKNSFKKNYEKRRQAWLQSFQDCPEAFFSNAIASKRELSGFCSGFIETILKLKIDRYSHCFYEYKKIIDKTFHVAAQMKGQIAWLWCFEKSIKQRYSFTIYSFAIKNITPTISENTLIELSLDIRGSNIVPAIETEYSFIFCLDDFTDKMDEDVNKEVLASIKDRAISPDGNIGKDDLFRAYRFA